MPAIPMPAARNWGARSGQDISGACGQLVIEHGGGGGGCSSSRATGPTDIEELARRPAATPVA
jgi:Fe-S cluster biogenesis protein NfuA